MPEKGSFLKFYDSQYQLKVPFVMYEDLESILKPTETPKPNPEESYTKEINQRISSGFCVYSQFAYGKVENPLKLYRRKDCVKAFCDYIENGVKRLYHTFPEKPMKSRTDEEQEEYETATK